MGKTRAEMSRALDAGVMCFNVESVGELELLSAVAGESGRSARVSLRVNPDVDPKTHPYISTGLRGNKFGIAHTEALAAYRRAARLPGRGTRAGPRSRRAPNAAQPPRPRCR